MMRICVIIMSKFIIILSKDMDRLKKYETGIVGSFLLSLLLLFSSCQNTGLMYDVSQPGTVYFVKTVSADAPVCSFVFAVASSRPNENASSGILLPVCLGCLAIMTGNL